MTATDRKLHALRQRLLRPVDAASLAIFRIGFGALMLVAVLRFFAHGWIAEYFLQPTHFFKYWGFGWVRSWPGPFMYVHFAAMALCALGVMLGYRYRASVLGFGALFAYAHLIDKTNYLNHYYLVVCLCAVMALLPLHACWSVDAKRRPSVARHWLPTWMLWTLRAQLGVVYVFGGIAKLNADWLVTAQPLSIWLARHSELPVLGALFEEPWAAHVMSWAGAVFDLSIVPLLLMRRTRPLAYLCIGGFHLLTARLFQLGMFPYIMMFGSLLFSSPSWPRELATRLRLRPLRQALAPSAPASFRASWAWPVLGVYFALQLALPLRHWLYPGSTCWTEQGYRFSWNVMRMEKNGSVDFRVVEPSSGRTYRVSPLELFTPYQTKMMAPQPDMVLQAAHLVAAEFRARGVRAPAVYVDAFASLNGRAMQRLIDPNVDLASQADDLSNKPWILAMKPSQEGRAALAWSPE